MELLGLSAGDCLLNPFPLINKLLVDSVVDLTIAPVSADWQAGGVVGDRAPATGDARIAHATTDTAGQQQLLAVTAGQDDAVHGSFLRAQP